MQGFVVFSNSLAIFLISEGFDLIQVRPDNKVKNRRVYIFKQEEGLFEAIQRHKALFTRFNVGAKG